MELLGLLAGLFIALFMAILFLTLLPDDDDGEATEDALGRVRQLACSLTGERAHDGPIQRRILALGAGGIGDLLAELNSSLSDFDAHDAQRIAHLEEVVADFGLVGLPTVARQLERMPAGSPLITSLIRIINRQGEAGADSAVRYGLSNPKFLPFLARFANKVPNERVARRLATSSAAQLDLDLTALATVIAQRPEILDQLWVNSASQNRCVILVWLRRWLPVCTVHHIIRGLEDESRDVRAEAAKLARLVVDPRLIPALDGLVSDDEDCQLMAAFALIAQNLEAAHPSLLRIMELGSSEAGLVALTGVLRARRAGALEGVYLSDTLAARLDELLGDRRPDDLVQLPFDALITALDNSTSDTHPLLIELLALKSATDPRAREKLISLGGGKGHENRVLAISALAQIGDDTAADLLVRAIGSINTASHLIRLQETAQHIGPGIVPLLTRRLRPSTGKRTGDVIAILRALPYGNALPSLLLALDDVREPFLESQLTSTCAIGLEVDSRCISALIDECERGLLMPLLRYMSVHSGPQDLPGLISWYDQHPSLRGLIGSLLEMQGSAAIDALRQRIERGGDDLLLLGLEAKLTLLEACCSESRISS